MRLDGEDVARRQRGAHRDRVEARRTVLAAPGRGTSARTARPDRRAGRVRGEHPLACRRHRRGVEEEVRPRQPSARTRSTGVRSAAAYGPAASPARPRSRSTGAGTSAPARPGRRACPPEALERADGVPDLDHRGRPAMWRDVHRQVGVVDDEQRGGAEQVRAPDQAGEVGELAHQAVAVRLEERSPPRSGRLAGSRRGGTQVALQPRHPRGGQHDARLGRDRAR